eukprot:5510184-Lingulodinium_polyedra.AAC.1
MARWGWFSGSLCACPAQAWSPTSSATAQPSAHGAGRSKGNAASCMAGWAVAQGLQELRCVVAWVAQHH